MGFLSPGNISVSASSAALGHLLGMTYRVITDLKGETTNNLVIVSQHRCMSSTSCCIHYVTLHFVMAETKTICFFSLGAERSRPCVFVNTTKSFMLQGGEV